MRTLGAAALLLLLASCAAPPRRAPPTEDVPGAAVEPRREVFVPARPPPRPEPVPAAPERPEPPAVVAVDVPPWPGTRALFPELEPLAHAAEFAQRMDRAAGLEARGRSREALALLEPLPPSPSPEALVLRGRIAASLGNPSAAARFYGAAVARTRGESSRALREQLGALLDTLGSDQLLRIAAACPFCIEGGEARLRLARRDAAAGEVGQALEILRDLTADFAAHPLGEAARQLAEDVVARGEVEPGLFGLLLPLSGPLHAFGDEALRGALLGAGLFLPEIDPGVRLAVADSRGDPEDASAGLEELVRRGVVGVVGPLKGNAAAAAASRARELGVPLVTLTPAQNIAGDGVFRLYLREEDEIDRLVEYAAEVRGMRRFAILYPNDPVGLRYRDLFWDRVVARGGEITGVEVIPEEAGGAVAAIRKITGVFDLSSAEIRERFLAEERVRLRREQELMAALGIEGEDPADSEPVLDPERLAEYEPPPVVDFEAVFLPVGSLAAAQIAPQFPYNDVDDVTLLGTRAWNHPVLVEVGDEYVAGAVFPAEAWPEAPGAREFASRYRETYGEEPGVIESYAYDAVRVMTRGTLDVLAETRPSLRRRLAGLWAADGVTGPLTSHPDGDIATSPRLLTVRRGRIVPVE